MATLEQANHTIEHMIRAIVDHPEAVSVTFSGATPKIVYRIRVAPEEIGKLIGKQGRTVTSIRILVMGMGKKIGMRFSVDISEALHSRPLCNQG